MNKRLLILLSLSILACIAGTVDLAMAAVSISVNPTTDSILPGSIRSVYSNVQGATDISATWTASGGTLVSSVGYTTWTAPATAGVYTVKATSVADKTQVASATFTVISSATVRVSNIPLQATIFKNQSLVIQSILWGSTNTAVKWSTSGGTLSGNGREVVFSASAAGTYTVKATSVADNSKTATTAIVVTDNPWPSSLAGKKTQPVDCTATGAGKTYNVTSEAEMDAVPWSNLGAGDTVRVHPGIYHRQLLVSTSGTEAQPIRICGVPDNNGNLPELNGANAKAKSGSNFGTGAGDMQLYGGITIYDRAAAYYGGAVYPRNIIIEGLKITGYNGKNTYTDLSTGLVTAYSNAATSIRVQHGANITIRGNDISDCGNGLFTMSNNGVESKTTRNLLIEGNHIHNNGVVNDYLEHQSYLQALGLVVQGNYYDYPLTGMPGGQLKTRSVQQFIRYNYFEAASRILDLVEVQDHGPFVYPWIGLDAQELANTSISDVVSNYEAYQDRFVYGNILHNVGSLTAYFLLHGGGDNDQDGNPGGTFYFYHNTVHMSLITGQTSNYRAGVVDFGPYETPITTHTVWPTVRLTNNAVYLAESTTPSGNLFFWNRWSADRVLLDKNWITTGWGTGASSGGDGTGISNVSPGETTCWQGGRVGTQVSGVSNLVTGNSIPFDATSYGLNPGSPLIDSSTSLPGAATLLPPLMQYNLTTHTMKQRSNIFDIGAISYDNIKAPQIINIIVK